MICYCVIEKEKQQIELRYYNFDTGDQIELPCYLQLSGKKDERNTVEYNTWRITILDRDNYTCQICKRKSGVLHVHHIKPFAVYKELRLDLDNGITLCKDCHLSKMHNRLTSNVDKLYDMLEISVEHWNSRQPRL